MIDMKETAKNLAAGAEALGASMEKFSERVHEASRELQTLSAMLPIDVGSALSVSNASPKRGEKFKLTEVYKPQRPDNGAARGVRLSASTFATHLPWSNVWGCDSQSV